MTTIDIMHKTHFHLEQVRDVFRFPDVVSIVWNL